MAEIKKIMCFCGSGLGSSFMMEMNVKKVLANLGIKNVTVEHTTLSEIRPGIADLYVCGEDLEPQAKKAGDCIALRNLVSIPELTGKLKEFFPDC